HPARERLILDVMQTMPSNVILETNIPGVPVRRGKVRDVYDAGDHVMLVATDRISAFDVVMASGIPGKGHLLTVLSRFWFKRFAGLIPHHLVEVIEDNAPPPFERYLDQLRGRATYCIKTQVVPIECVVRGYRAGSGRKDYQKTGRVCGGELRRGLRQWDV